MWGEYTYKASAERELITGGLTAVGDGGSPSTVARLNLWGLDKPIL